MSEIYRIITNITEAPIVICINKNLLEEILKNIGLKPIKMIKYYNQNVKIENNGFKNTFSLQDRLFLHFTISNMLN